MSDCAGATSPGIAPSTESQIAHDVCALPLVRRLAAMLDRAEGSLREGDSLPRGWHVLLFNAPTRQAQLRDDGAAYLGVNLPDIGLPRLMLGGRQNQFLGDIPIGAKVRRETRQGAVQMKEGRSGRFALVQVEHRIFADGGSEPAVVEAQDFILREASAPSTLAAAAPMAPTLSTSKSGTPNPSTLNPSTAMPSASTASEGELASAADPLAANARRTIVPDERMLFRYSAMTDNPHRIHYDQHYATVTEGYPALVVNGSIPAMFLLDLFRSTSEREPSSFSSRNLAPMFCGRLLQLNVQQQDDSWRLWATDESGATTFDARAD
ncbi:MAG: 3-methylfumaryl-CoA hydratase [Gammaproteobacteria bacterium]|jgi:3-methylfumaryl-CoA hydratase